MFGLINKILIVSLTGQVNGTNHTKCVSLSNQKWNIAPILITLHSNKYSQEFHYYPLSVKLDRYVGNCNTLIDLSNRVSIPTKTEGLNLSVFNKIANVNESKLLTKHISCECKCKLDGIKCNSNQWWNNDKCWCESKKHQICLESCYT